MFTKLTMALAMLPLVVACGGRPAPRNRTAEVPATQVYSPSPDVLAAETFDAEEDEVAMDDAMDDTGVLPMPVASSPEVIAAEVGEPIVTYHLRRGESLAHFARWSDLPVEIIAEASEQPLDAALPVGTVVRVPASPDRRSRIEASRDAHHERRTEGYLASRGGAVDTEFYVVRTGDSGWGIAKRHGLPVWLVEAFNPSLDFEGLRPGQAVMLPVTADMVDAADDTDAMSALIEP